MTYGLTGNGVILATVAIAVVIALAIAIGSHVRSKHLAARLTADWPVEEPNWWRSGLGLAGFLLGLALSVTLLFLTVWLVLRLWQDLFSTGIGAGACVPAAPASATSANKLNGAGISDALTAISVAVALVTLVISLGAQWLNSTQQRLDKQLRKVDKALERAGRWQALQSQRSAVVTQALIAKRAVLHWLIPQVSGKSFDIRVQTLFLYLDQLALPDREQRIEAFVVLFRELAPRPGDPDDERELSPVRTYTEACHDYIVAHAAHGDESFDLGRLRAMEKAGLACKIFDADEIYRVTGLR